VAGKLFFRSSSDRSPSADNFLDKIEVGDFSGGGVFLFDY